MTSPIWHPFTQHGLAGPAIHIDSAKGAHLYAKDGRAIIDAISSWWVNTHGHCHPKITAAVQEQAAKLDQVIFAGFTHEPAERLAEKLLRHAGAPFKHVFFSDSGSTSVEVALKMAIGYWRHKNQNKTTILALEHGYHGDTFGAMALSARSVFTKIYEDFLFDVARIPFPTKSREDETLQRLETLLRSGKVAALILEPLVLGAGGMLMYEPGVLKKMRALCDQYDALLIADEVLTGFGRTGSMFACDQANIKPDIMCLSKGLTGGFLPIGATLCRAEIYDAFYSQDRGKMFFHSSSFMANPMSCAAALASLEIWETETVLERIQAIAAAHKAAAKNFALRDDINNIRQTGAILAFDVNAPEGYLSPIAPRLYDIFLSKSILLRPLGNTVYILPPYCITKEEVGHVYDVIRLALDNLRDERQQRRA